MVTNNDSLPRIVKKKTLYFYASAFCYFGLLTCIIVMLPIILETKPFFNVRNGSNYVDIANLFSKVDFYLRGHCVTLIDTSVVCNQKPFYTLFYSFPDFSTFPSRFTQDDLVPYLFKFSTQNPLVFIPIVLSIIIAFGCVAFGVVAYRTTARKSISRTTIASGVLLVMVSIALGIAAKIYTDVIPGYLNKPITINVVREGQEFSITGKLSDVGIKFGTGEGMNILVAILVLCVCLVCASVRWIFEGNVPKDDQPHSRIRQVFF